MQTLEGNGAVVTGGTLGVGGGIVSELPRYGARVFLTGRSVRDGSFNDQPITHIPYRLEGLCGSAGA